MMTRGRRYLLLPENKELSKSLFFKEDNGGMMSSKPNFKQMSLKELRSYILAHRDDQEAWEEFTSRERPNAIYFDKDMPQSEQEKRLRELLS